MKPCIQSFILYMLSLVEASKVSLYEKRCMVQISSSGNQHYQSAICVPKGWNTLCDTKITLSNNSAIRSCCCEDRLCNDINFIKTCQRNDFSSSTDNSQLLSISVSIVYLFYLMLENTL